MAALVVPAALLGGAAGAASFLVQTSTVSTPLRATIQVSIMVLAEAAGSAFAARVPERGATQQIVFAVAGAVACTLALTWPAALPGAAVILSLLTGLAEPLRDAAIQRVASDDARARAASLAKACDMLCSTLLLPLAGVWGSRRR
jgi:hypothetical protein